MTTILGELDTRLKELLQPLLVTWDLHSITTEDFAAAQTFNELVEKYRSELPAAFLSFPTIRYPDARPRVPQFTATYRLLAGADVRQETAAAFIYSFHERVANTLFLQTLPRALDLPAQLDYIRLRTYDSAVVTTDAGPLGVALMTFDLEVRNWQVNEPA